MSFSTLTSRRSSRQSAASLFAYTLVALLIALALLARTSTFEAERATAG